MGPRGNATRLSPLLTRRHPSIVPGSGIIFQPPGFMVVTLLVRALQSDLDVYSCLVSLTRMRLVLIP